MMIKFNLLVVTVALVLLTSSSCQVAKNHSDRDDEPAASTGEEETKALAFSSFDDAVSKFSSSGMLAEKDLEGAFVFKMGRVELILREYDAVIAGGLTSNEIMTVIRSHLNGVATCYMKVMPEKGAFSCPIKANFTIGLDGKVTQARALSKSCPEALKSCVAQELKTMVFPVPRGSSPVQVVYPFIFQPL